MKTIVLALAAASFGAASANAATIYTDRASFLAAITGAVTEDFEENGPGLFTSYGSTYTGAGFSIGGTSLFTVDPGFDPAYDWSTGDVLDFETGPGTITTTASALGFDFGNPTDFPGNGTITINGVGYTLTGQPTFNFFGIVDTGPLGPITLDFGGGLGILDNLTTGVGGVVPEPASWALMIVGFGLVGAAARRRRFALAE